MCIHKHHICDNQAHCPDLSDELCNDRCVQEPLHGPQILRMCHGTDTCLPMEKVCDRIIDVQGCQEDEGECTCKDWHLERKQYNGASLCQYPEWKNHPFDTDEALTLMYTDKLGKES